MGTQPQKQNEPVYRIDEIPQHLRQFFTPKKATVQWDFEGVAQQLWRIIKPGGVVVWIVGDATIDGSETGTSFRQAVRFMEIGFRLHDTMIYHRQGQNPSNKSGRYWQNFEYMFVLANGAPRATNLIRDKLNKYKSSGSDAVRQRDGSLKRGNRNGLAYRKYGYRENIWYYAVGGGNIGEGLGDHPAPFPEALARDHIRSWSNEGDLILDPFAGSFTSCKMARELGRHSIGIEINEAYCQIGVNRLRQKVLF